MTAVLEEPKLSGPTDDDPFMVNHYFCDCDENTALCGDDLTDCSKVDFDHDDENDCPMCLMLLEADCPNCGSRLGD